MRKALTKALRPKRLRQGAMDTHAALLDLAMTREGVLRLVTTNFDRTFQRVAWQDRRRFDVFSAPMLPVPKPSQWNGLVYLHGLLPAKEADARALDRLVVTSGDFGLAYLTERWAARFVNELFLNYVVCFVGYSINDPVLRYMMDALAADRLRGEAGEVAYAMDAYDQDEKDATIADWKAKGVTPVLYNRTEDHAHLHSTLKVWAEDYRNGIRGKERVVVEHGISNPSASTKQEDFVGRMLWALSDKTGAPARRFAELEPVPSLDWLKALSNDRYRHEDLLQFDVPPRPEVNEDLSFSLVYRPAPYDLAPRMALAASGFTHGQWDDVMFHLARWLVRHLNDSALIIWLAQRGARLHPRFVWLVEHELERLDNLQKENKTEELDGIRRQAPNAIPSPRMQTLWCMLLTGKVKPVNMNVSIYDWIARVKRSGLTSSLRMQLRELLTPKITLQQPFVWDELGKASDDTQSMSELVDWELVLTADDVQASLAGLPKEIRLEIVPDLLNDLQTLLLDALSLLEELGSADERSDRSFIDLPSISPHPQNQKFRDWVALIELLRESWEAIRKNGSRTRNTNCRRLV